VNVAMMEADQDGDGKLSFDEFKDMVASTDIAKQMVSDTTLSFLLYVGRGADDVECFVVIQIDSRR